MPHFLCLRQYSKAVSAYKTRARFKAYWDFSNLRAHLESKWGISCAFAVPRSFDNWLSKGTALEVTIPCHEWRLKLWRRIAAWVGSSMTYRVGLNDSRRVSPCFEERLYCWSRMINWTKSTFRAFRISTPDQKRYNLVRTECSVGSYKIFAVFLPSIDSSPVYQR